jgi:hypothetical protein
MWQWEIYTSGKALPIEKGMVKGAEAKAYKAGRQAIARLNERHVEAAKNRQK